MTDAVPTPSGKAVRRSAQALIASSGLPPEAKHLIASVLHRTGLWRREKAEVALELISHFQDGIEAGRSIDDLLATFGPAKTSAKLIRRAKKRCRPLWWRLLRRVEAAIALFFLIYLASIVVFSIRHPRVTVDYVALANRSIEAIPARDRAWPIYREAWIEGRIGDINQEELQARDAAGNASGRYLRPTDADWPRVTAFLARHKVLLDAARIGAKKPSIGLPLLSWSAYEPRDREALLSGRSPEFTIPANQLGTHVFTMCDLLAWDIQDASIARDSDRVLADCLGLLGLARQMREWPTIGNQFECVAILQVAARKLAETNFAYPAVLTKHRVTILHAMAAAEPLFAVDFSADRMRLDDLIQRNYSDDDHGDGALTLEGARATTDLIRRLDGHASAQYLLLPIAVSVNPSRKAVSELVDRSFVLARQTAAQPFWERLRLPFPSEADKLSQELQHRHHSNSLDSMILQYLPRVDGWLERTDTAKALFEATIVALALDVYRDKHGAYAAALADLVPQYLPTHPLDYSTGGQLRYKLKAGKPLLYGLGLNGKDDGGVSGEKRGNFAIFRATGDWILYPPSE